MNAVTKLALCLLFTFGIGVGLIFAGTWPNYKIGAFIAGMVVAIASSVAFSALWRSGR